MSFKITPLIIYKESNYMAEYEELKKKIDHLEYDEIGQIKEDLTQVKLELNTNNLLTKQSIESNQKLSATMDTMRESLIEITNSLKNSNRISSELTQSIKDLNEKVNTNNAEAQNQIQKLSDKIEKIDDKSKLDIASWVKANWFKLIIVIFGASILVAEHWKIGALF